MFTLNKNNISAAIKNEFAKGINLRESGRSWFTFGVRHAETAEDCVLLAAFTYMPGLYKRTVDSLSRGDIFDWVKEIKKDKEYFDTIDAASSILDKIITSASGTDREVRATRLGKSGDYTRFMDFREQEWNVVASRKEQKRF